ncbi:hypothetical protein HNY73_005934 [Argiope bruennichi]|uniref:Uncharacterized protein n=1 Tax=Argiope bruennichi TaxID=94029 RepID=A0A8T0FJ80_ARGBR|nr:hypothetical protein HNY73_005934 [Argiope bruennichi]
MLEPLSGAAELKLSPAAAVSEPSPAAAVSEPSPAAAVSEPSPAATALEPSSVAGRRVPAFKCRVERRGEFLPVFRDLFKCVITIEKWPY